MAFEIIHYDSLQDLIRANEQEELEYTGTITRGIPKRANEVKNYYGDGDDYYDDDYYDDDVSEMSDEDYDAYANSELTTDENLSKSYHNYQSYMDFMHGELNDGYHIDFFTKTNAFGSPKKIASQYNFKGDDAFYIKNAKVDKATFVHCVEDTNTNTYCNFYESNNTKYGKTFVPGFYIDAITKDLYKENLSEAFVRTFDVVMEGLADANLSIPNAIQLNGNNGLRFYWILEDKIELPKGAKGLFLLTEIYTKVIKDALIDFAECCPEKSKFFAVPMPTRAGKLNPSISLGDDIIPNSKHFTTMSMFKVLSEKIGNEFISAEASQYLALNVFDLVDITNMTNKERERFDSIRAKSNSNNLTDLLIAMYEAKHKNINKVKSGCCGNFGLNKFRIKELMRAARNDDIDDSVREDAIVYLNGFCKRLYYSDEKCSRICRRFNRTLKNSLPNAEVRKTLKLQTKANVSTKFLRDNLNLDKAYFASKNEVGSVGIGRNKLKLDVVEALCKGKGMTPNEIAEFLHMSVSEVKATLISCIKRQSVEFKDYPFKLPSSESLLC